MPMFKCNNPLCKDFGEEEFIPHVKFVWNEETKHLEANEAACKECGKQREVVRDKGPIQIPWFKAENSRNYDNKKIKKYDYDREAFKSESEPVKLSRKEIQKTAERN